MDRRTEQQFDSCLGAIIGGIYTLIIWLITTLIGGLIGVVIKSSEKNPEDELLKLKTTIYQRQQIHGIACPDCKTKNEEHQSHCYMCGSVLVQQIEKTSWSNNTIQIAAGVALILLVVITISLTNWRKSQNVTVQASKQNNQVVVNLPTATISSEKVKVEIREYLDAVANTKCDTAMNAYLVNNDIYRERCENGYFQVHQIDSIVRVRKLDSNITLFLARGRFVVEDSEYNTLHFKIVEGKLKEFPQPQGTPMPYIQQAKERNFSPKTEIKVIVRDYLNAMEISDCRAARTYFSAERGIAIPGCEQYHLEILNIERTRPARKAECLLEVIISGEFNIEGVHMSEVHLKFDKTVCHDSYPWVLMNNACIPDGLC